MSEREQWPNRERLMETEEWVASQDDQRENEWIVGRPALPWFEQIAERLDEETARTIAQRLNG